MRGAPPTFRTRFPGVMSTKFSFVMFFFEAQASRKIFVFQNATLKRSHRNVQCSFFRNFPNSSKMKKSKTISMFFVNGKDRKASYPIERECKSELIGQYDINMTYFAFLMLFCARVALRCVFHDRV